MVTARNERFLRKKKKIIIIKTATKISAEKNFFF
jgi:hypothetical protein